MRGLELAPYSLCGQGFVLQTALALIAGSFMIQHCANTITSAGVGNGSTLVICTGIITGQMDQPCCLQWTQHSSTQSAWQS
jgi:preprotein translocase subunit SecY